MRNSADPTVHRERERRVVEHVERLLGDDRLRVETTAGRRAVAMLRRDVHREDGEVQLKRLMSELGVPDRALQARMPVGLRLEVTLSRTVWLVLRKVIGEMVVMTLSPREALIRGEEAPPLSRKDVKAALQQDVLAKVPTTIVVVSTSGFEDDARAMAGKSAANDPWKTLILVEPNDAGGWTVSGPAEARALCELLDPEVDADKRMRIRETLACMRAELLGGGVSAERVALATSLPVSMVEDELRLYARETSGLVARRLQGSVVLFREGTAPISAPLSSRGGPDMAFIQRVRSLFSRKGDNEKKIALLSERRATLSVQRDQAFEEMGVLEQRETDLREQFKSTTSTITKRRVTSQLVQLRKDLERRQQLLGMLNQQINVVSTHLHNLELVQQGQSASLPSSEELAEDAAAAEEVLAELQADDELAGSMATGSGAGLSEEEQALYEELERESAEEDRAAGPSGPMAGPTAIAPIPERKIPLEPPPLPTPERRPSEPEPG